MCADHILPFILLWIFYSNNIVTISLSHSHFPLSLWKDDNLNINLNEKREAYPLTTEFFCASLVHT